MLRELQTWVGTVPGVGEARGVGLSMGVELVHDQSTKAPAPELAQQVTRKVWDEGLVVLPPAGAFGNVVRFAPALCISEEEALSGLDRLRRTIGASAADREVHEAMIPAGVE
jgi:4-aminobutyrate aminotransferase-like enzyme